MKSTVISDTGRWLRYAGLLFAAVIVAQSAAAPPTPSVAVISDVVGEAYLVAPHAFGDQPVTVLSEIKVGEVLRLEPGCRLIIIFVPGGQVVELDGAGRFQIGAESVEPLDRGGAARTRQRGEPTRMLAQAHELSEAA